MTTRFKHLLSVFVFFIFIALALACYSVKDITFTKEGGEIPQNFHEFKDTLLVISHSEIWGYNKYLKKNFAANYTGNYKIIKPSEIGNYPADQYRYMFDQNLNFSSKTTTTSTPITGGGHVSNGGFNTSTHSFTYPSSAAFFVKDRITQQAYVTKSSAFYSKLMAAYVKALDEERGR